MGGKLSSCEVNVCRLRKARDERGEQHIDYKFIFSCVQLMANVKLLLEQEAYLKFVFQWKHPFLFKAIMNRKRRMSKKNLRDCKKNMKIEQFFGQVCL